MNASNPGLPALISMLVGIQKETEENSKQIVELRQRVEELEN